MKFNLFLMIATCTGLGIVLTIAVAAHGFESSVAWEPVYDEDFSDDSWRKMWKLDGDADLSTEEEGDTDFLRIKTIGSEVNTRDAYSTLWLRKRFQGDVLIQFRARAESGSRALLYMNANPTKRSGYQNLFDWNRPDAKMLRYAGTGLMELYSVGILRNDQGSCNLRYLGGDEMSKLFVAQRPVFAKVSVLASYESPFVGRPPNTWFEFSLEIRGNQIAFDVDDRNVIEQIDTGEVKHPHCRWKPLTNGGCIAIRNFKATTVCLDSIRVYQVEVDTQ